MKSFLFVLFDCQEPNGLETMSFSNEAIKAMSYRLVFFFFSLGPEKIEGSKRAGRVSVLFLWKSIYLRCLGH